MCDVMQDASCKKHVLLMGHPTKAKIYIFQSYHSHTNKNSTTPPSYPIKEILK